MLFFILSFILAQITTLIGNRINSLSFFNINLFHNTYASILRKWFNYKIYTQNKLIKGKKIIYLSNHRSWSDFCIEYDIFDCNTTYISRMMVIIALPFMGLATYMCNIVYYFNRGAGRNPKQRDRFFNKIYKFFMKSYMDGMLVYPEGTRCSGSQINPLKCGFIYFSFDKKIPIQIAITKNKELVFNEKKMVANTNIKLYTYYSKLIKPEKFNTKEEYFEYINKTWKTIWNKLYSKEFNPSEYTKKNIDVIHKFPRMKLNDKIKIHTYYWIENIILFLLAYYFFF